MLSPRQRRQVASHTAELIDPDIAGDDAALVAHVGSARIALPSGTRVAPGNRGVLYALISGELHVLVESGSIVRELVIDDDLSAQLRAEHFNL